MAEPIVLLISVTSAFIVSVIAWPLTYRFLVKIGCVIQNYRAREVVNCAGLLIPLAFVVAVGMGALFDFNVGAIAPVLIMVLAASFFGVLDDLLGSGGSKGFRGHLRSLAEGELTTGALKAFGIGLVALYVAGMRSSGWMRLADAAVIALAVNVVNLLDLRPGRALKAFVAVDALLLVVSPLRKAAGQWVGMAPALVLLGPDLKEKSMLGDVGSNALGAVLGTGFVFNFTWQVRLAVLVFLLVMQLFAERYSITEAISKVAFLRRLDELGRVDRSL